MINNRIGSVLQLIEQYTPSPCSGEIKKKHRVKHGALLSIQELPAHILRGLQP
jgi:hypothetical protein